MNRCGSRILKFEFNLLIHGQAENLRQMSKELENSMEKKKTSRMERSDQYRGFQKEAKDKEIQSDQKAEEYEAIQGDEEILVDKRVGKAGKEAAVVTIETIHTKLNNNSKNSARRQHSHSKCFNRSENLANQKAKSNSSAAVKANSRTIEVRPSSPEMVELESRSAKDLQGQRGEKKQVKKEKEKFKKVFPVPVIEISDDEGNDADKVFVIEPSSHEVVELNADKMFAAAVQRFATSVHLL